MSGFNVFRANTTSKSLKRPKGRDPSTWWLGRPLTDGKNAHRTNTREQLNIAMRDGSNWFEGDIRRELHGERMEMRHDATSDTRDNLSLAEWLKMGRASGRGLKLDVKEPQHMVEIVREVKAAGIPSERIMWNLGDAAMATWAAKLRQQFPRSILAINPTGADSDKRVSSSEVARMMALAKRGAGGPIAFVIRYDRLTNEAIQALRPMGNISVWSNMGRPGLTKENLPEVVENLNLRGVDGVIDLERSYGAVDKVKVEVDRLQNVAGEFLRNQLRRD